MLLDEATSALDIGNEIAIGDAVDAIRGGRTLIVIAHRLQTTMTADQITMLDGAGGIEEPGTGANASTPSAGRSPPSRDRWDGRTCQPLSEIMSPG